MNIHATLARLLAALETPGDLTDEEKRHVIEDGAALLEALQDPSASHGPRVLIDMSRGVVQQVTADLPVEVVVLDHEIKLPDELHVQVEGDRLPAIPWRSPHLAPDLVSKVYAQLDGAPAVDAKPAMERIHALQVQQGWGDQALVRVLLELFEEHPAIARTAAEHLQAVADSENVDDTPEPEPGQSCDDFEDAYGPVIRAPDGDLLRHADIVDAPQNTVWTVVEGDYNTLHVMAGVRLVNRLGYVLTTKPWSDESGGLLSYRWDS